jgi:hypothetical protein
MKKTLLLAAIVFVSIVQGAAGATAPAVSTSSASSVGPNSATLNGSVNPNGASTSWYFEYGSTTSYGAKTSTQNAGSGTSSVAVSAPISGLQANHTYHFRLVASSGGGSSQGADETFSTGNAPGVTTSAASSVGSTTAKLNGSLDPNGQSTSWYFEYGTSTSYGTKTSSKSAGSGTASTGVSASVSGLTAGSTYHFRLVATNASGATYGSDQSFTTAGPPAVQTNAAANIATTAATLTGTVDPKGRSTTWYFDYGTTTAYGSRTASQSAGSGTGAEAVSVTVSNLTAGTAYHYRIVATSSAGTGTGADVGFTTLPAVTMAKPASKVVAGHYVKLSGTVSGGQTGVSVTVLAQAFGASAQTQVATVLTGAGGAWTYLARPQIETAYQASASGGTSASFTIGVQPAISLQLITGARFATRVSAASSFAGKVVQLQRLSGKRWVTVKRAPLNPGAVFAAKALPRGLSKIRIAFSVNQAGPGYLAGFSRTLTYRRH